jgi:hypothetical protein
MAEETDPPETVWEIGISEVETVTPGLVIPGEAEEY